MKSKLFLDVHAIQTVPPANINRDDTGSPKTAQYGGVTRARVSSQSWKRAMRMEFPEELKGVRTKRFNELCVDYLESSDEIDKLSFKNAMMLLMDIAGFSVSEKDGEAIANALFFYSKKQIQNLLNYYFENKDLITKLTLKYITELEEVKTSKKKDLKKFRTFTKEEKEQSNLIKGEICNILANDSSVDICLFGRMLAGKKDLLVDASSQVAHAISTHAIESEFDFFTAVDDLATEDNPGAGMLGTVEYNSSTLYRYANIAVHELYKQLGDKENAIEASEVFTRTFIKSMPTGKINSFANQTLPSAIVVTLRLDRPVNMVSAFEEPVKSNEGYVKKSVQKLFDEYSLYDNMLEKPIYTAYYTFKDYGVVDIGKKENSIGDLVKNLGVELNSALEKIK